MRAEFEVVKSESRYILVKDLCKPNTITVTNDVHRVTSFIIYEYNIPFGKKIYYIDSNGRIDELEHNGETFIGFKFGYKNIKEFEAYMADEA